METKIEMKNENNYYEYTFIENNELHCLICKLIIEHCNCCLLCKNNENLCTCCIDCFKLESECICCVECRGPKTDCNCHLCDICTRPLTDSCDCKRKELERESEEILDKYWINSYTRPSNDPNL